MFCMKWENARITGIKVYKWNEKLARNDIPRSNGLFVFRRHHDRRIMRVLSFAFRYLLEALPISVGGEFRAHPEGLEFSSLLLRSGFFWLHGPEAASALVRDLTDFFRANFHFSSFTTGCPYAPRLVFVVDFSYTPALRYGCPPSSLPYVTRQGKPICTERHAGHESDWALTDEQEEYFIDYCPSFETDFDMGEDESGSEVGPDDVEASYTEEMKEIVRSIRRYRCVGRTFPLEGRSSLDRAGLLEVASPVVWTLPEAQPGSDCPICFSGLEEGEVAMKTKCGHVFHRDCVLRWLGTRFTCPCCRSYSIMVL